MACALTSNLSPKECKVPAGVDELLVMEWSNLTNGASGVTYTSNVVTAMTITTGKQFRKYTFRPGNATFKATPAASGASGSFGYTYEVTGFFDDISTATIEELHLLLQNRAIVIAKLRNGDYWMIGQEYGMDGAAPADAGKASGDAAGSTLTLTGEGNLPMKKVDSTLIASLLAPAV